MTTPLLRALIAALSILLAAPTAHAQGRIRLAIWEVENNAGTRWWFSNDLGPAARNHIDTAFAEDPKLSAAFSIVERDKLNLVLKEQGMAASGLLDPQSAAKIGKILGVRYILVGGIDKFSIDNTRAGVRALGGIGGNVVQATATLNLRLIDTTTAERVLAVQGDAEVRRGGATFRGNTLSRDAEWGLADETVQKAARTTIEKFAAGGYVEKLASAAAPARGLEGRVIKVDAARAWINLGAKAGLKVGDRFNVIAVGEALIDPDTGANLGAEEKQIGSGEVVDVQELFAVINLTGTANAKDTVRRLP